MTRDDSENVAGIERHLQSIIATLILAAVLWVGKSVTDQQATLATVLSRLDAVEKRFDAMDSKFALKESSDFRFQALEQRVGQLERVGR